MTLQEWCEKNNREDILRKWSSENTITPNDLTYGSIIKVKWTCENNHTWEATPNKMTQRSSVGCPYCANKKVWKGYNDLETLFPDVAVEWSKKRNGFLLPSEVTAHSNKTVWWICPKGHEYEAPVSWRTNGKRRRGCPYCANKRVFKGYNDLSTVCPEVAKEWHPTKNGKITPDKVLSSTTKKYWWICPNGHEYQASLNNRVINGKLGQGCPYCSGHQVLKGYNDLASTNPEIANEWHPTKNVDITPEQIVAGAHKKYWWICPVGHEYQASPESRTKNNGTGCPICAQQSQTSFPEQAIYFYIRKMFSDAKNRYSYDGKEIDIYIPSLSLGIEYDGSRFHTDDILSRDIQKDIYFAEKGIKLIRVKEYKNRKGKEQDSIIWINNRDKYENTIPLVIGEIIKRIGISIEIDVDIKRDRTEILNQYYVALKHNSFAEKHPELKTEWDYEKNGHLKIEMFSSGSGIKVWWKCRQGHSYQMSFDARGKGIGCPICAGQQLLRGFNDFATRYPQIAKEWCYEMNGDLSPDSVMPGTRKKVWWECAKGHVYQASVSGRTNTKSGCPYCSGKKAVSGNNDLCTKYPWITDFWNYEKNNGIDPTLTSPFSHKKVWWRCSNGHEFEKPISAITTYYDKYQEFRCPECVGKRTKSVINLDTGEVYQSLEEAARSCGLKKGDTIGLCCAGKQKKAGGYRWSYKD